MFNVHPIPAFDDNYIWLLSEPNSDDVVVVDPGDFNVVNAYLSERGKNLVAILITHHHKDHTGGVEALVAKYTVPVYGPKNSKFQGISVALNDGDEVSILGQNLQVKTVPGHTLDHICYVSNDIKKPQLFCGDMLFLAGCGRVFEGSMQQMLAAMHYFKALPINTEVYCTHEYSLANLAFAQAVEPNNEAISIKIEQCHALRQQGKATLPSTIGAELTHNPFLRTEQAAMIKTLSLHAGIKLKTEVDIFRHLRTWKDNF